MGILKIEFNTKRENQMTIKQIIKGILLVWICVVLGACNTLQNDEADTDDSATSSVLGASASANVVINDELAAPVSIVSDSNGHFYIADTENNRIVKMNESGEILTTFGSLGSGKGQFYFPKGLAIDKAGYIWVADMNNDRIVRFNPSSLETFNNSFWSYGSLGSESTQFTTPLDVAVKTYGDQTDVYVVDADNSRIQIIPVSLETNSVTTSNITSWEFDNNVTYGKGINLFIGEDGYVYVARKKGVVEKYSARITTGEPVYSGRRFAELQLSEDPGDIFVANSKVYVVDHGYNKIYVYSSVGSLLKTYGKTGASVGYLESPEAIYVNDENLAFVVEEGNNRIQTFKAE